MARQNNSINDAIDQLVDQLAAFCLDKIEQNMRDGDDNDIDISVEQLEEEYRVRGNDDKRMTQLIRCSRRS
jgi:hypothetical protein